MADRAVMLFFQKLRFTTNSISRYLSGLGVFEIANGHCLFLLFSVSKVYFCDDGLIMLEGHQTNRTVFRGRLLVSGVPMVKQWTAKLGLNSVLHNLNLIALFTVSSQKVTFSTVVY